MKQDWVVESSRVQDEVLELDSIRQLETCKEPDVVGVHRPVGQTILHHLPSAGPSAGQGDRDGLTILLILQTTYFLFLPLLTDSRSYPKNGSLPGSFPDLEHFALFWHQGLKYI